MHRKYTDATLIEVGIYRINIFHEVVETPAAKPVTVYCRDVDWI